MNKIVDGVELMRMIRDNELSEEIEITDINNQKWNYNGEELIAEKYIYSDIVFANMTFELKTNEIEEIHMDNLNELPLYENIETYNNMSIRANRLAINDLIKAVKQINRKLEGK